MMILKIIGGLLVLWGIADLFGSFMDIDVWYDWLGIELSGIVYKYSAWAEIIIGGVLFSMGGKDDGEEAGEA